MTLPHSYLCESESRLLIIRVSLILVLFVWQQMTDDLFHSMYIPQSLRFDEIHQVVVSTVDQEVLHMIFRLGSTLLVLNLRCSRKSIQTEEEVARIFILLTLLRVVPGPCRLIVM